MWNKFSRLLVIFALSLTVLLLTGSVQLTNAQGPLAPSGDGGQTYYAPFPVAITLDGDSADWEGVPRVIMSDGGDPEVVFAAASDGENLFFLANVTDSTIITGQNGTDYWNEDSVEFYINATGDLNLRTYIDGVAQINIPALNIDLPSEEAIVSGVRGSTANATLEAVATDDGYLIEVAVPLQNDVWDIEVAHGNAIGFQVHLNGARQQSRDTKLIWSIYDSNDQSYQNPSLFGTLIFFEIGSEDVPDAPARGGEDGGSALPPVNESALYRNGRLPPEARVIDLMARMTLEEKIGQMTLVEVNSMVEGDIAAEYIGGILSGGGGYPNGANSVQGWTERLTRLQSEALSTRLGIPIIYGVDAVHGHNNLYGATIFPHNIGLGATRNADLVREVCRITAIEMVATGIYWNYAPVLAVPQDIRWGRTYEGYAQDTDLVTELAMACMEGMQGEDLSDPLNVLATPKHFVGDGGAVWGTSTTGDYIIDRGETAVDEETLRAIHLAPYVTAMDYNAQSVMISYSSWNGLKMHAQQYLITEVLKGELAFDGFVVSDWAGIDEISDDYYEAVVTAINAGVDMNMVPYNYIGFIETVKQAVNAGDISMSRIDDAVRRILLVKFRLGLFETPYADTSLEPYVGSGLHREVARRAVAESQVLLKNDDVLPLSPDVETILVAGEAADNIGIQSGGWTIEWQGVDGDSTIGTTVLEGIQSAVGANTVIEYAADGDFGDATASVGIVVVGERPYAEGVGDDPELALLPEDLAAIDNLRGSVDQLVVIIISGRPLIITDYLDNWDAVVAAWLPGTEGQGVADVLFGYRPFTGQLSFAWPASVDQLPMTPDNDDNALFAYGFGLTTEATQAPPTTTFTLSDFQMEALPEPGLDEFGNGIGYVPWGGEMALSVVPAEGDVAVPEQDTDNYVLQVDYNIGAFGGFSYLPIMDESWAAWDWSDYKGIQFWLYGNNTGGIVQFEIFDNRDPNSNSDTAERFFYPITDDYEGWQFFSIPFSDFQRRSDWQPDGALEDGFGLLEVSGIAFGFPAGVGAHTAYIDGIKIYGGTAGVAPRVSIPAASRPPVATAPVEASATDEVPTTEAAPEETVFLATESTILADFEMEALPEVVTDEFGNNLGFVSWGDTAGNVSLAIEALEGESVLAISYDVAGFGGFSWIPSADGVWESQDWSAYDALQLALYGNNTGGTIQLEIFDNRNPDSTGDSAERYFYHIVDNYEGWQTFTVPFGAFERRSDWQPDGAPDDGLGLTEVNGLALGFPVGTGAQVSYLDNVALVTGEEVPMSEYLVSTYPWDGEWGLIWADEFDAEAETPPNAEFWTCEVGGWGWGNNEWQYYTETGNAFHNGEGQMVITAREETVEGSDCWNGECQYSSARCITMDKFEFTFGRVEMRAQIPYGQGIWPAFWMLGADFPEVGWPNSGEIDIMENVGHELNTVHGTVHGPGYSGSAGRGRAYSIEDEPFSAGFHVYSIEWEPNVIRWYVDGELFFEFTPEGLNREYVFNKDFFLLINLAVGGNWPGYPDETTEFPQNYTIDYIRVYQRQAAE